jgi:hypothetical protein
LSGDTDVKRLGNTATTTISTISTAEIQKLGRRRIDSQASAHVLRAFCDSSSLSMAATGVSSRGAT